MGRTLLLLACCGLGLGVCLLGVWGAAAEQDAAGDLADMAAPPFEVGARERTQLSPAARPDAASPLWRAAGGELSAGAPPPGEPPALASPTPAEDAAWLLVLDAGGRPLPGARVHDVTAWGGGSGSPARGPARQPADATDAKGRFVVDSLGATYLITDAAHLPRRVRVSVRGETRAELRAAGRLEVLVEAPVGLDHEHLRVVVRAGEGLLAGDLDELARLARARGGTPWTHALVGDGRSELSLRPEPLPLESDGRRARSRVQLAGVRPGVPFEVELRDRLSQLRARRGFVRVAAGETRRVLFDVSAEPRALDVIVRAPDGTPLPGARVWLRVPEGRFGGLTDERGRHVFEGLFAERVALEVDQPGWLPYRVDALPVASGRVDVVLGQGRSLEVLLVDGRHGGVVPAEALLARWSVNGVEVSDLPVGTSCGVDGAACRLDGVPDGELRLRATVGGRVYETVHDARDGALRWELPCHGELALRLPATVADGTLLAVRLDELDAAGAARHSIERQLHHAAGDDVPLGPVLAGRYRVGVRAFAGAAFEALGAAQVIDVPAHERRLVSLGR